MKPTISFKNFTKNLFLEDIGKKLSDDDNNFLAFLVHDKSHVIDKSRKHPIMDKVFKLTKNKKFNKPLYRGLYNEKITEFEIGKNYTFPYYQSFSESEKTAKIFSKNKLILQFNKAKGGFNYGKYQADWLKELKKDDPEEYDGSDGDWLLQTAEEEAEHIFNTDTKVKIVNITKRSGFTYIECEIY